MSPLEFAQALVDDLKARYGQPPTPQLPEPYLAQLGDLVIDCPGTFVTILSKSEQDLGGNCGSVATADVVAAIARDCAHVANEDGTTDHAAMTAVSAGMDHDAEILQEWGDKLYAESWFRLGRPTITFVVQGGLAVVTMNVTLPIP